MNTCDHCGPNVQARWIVHFKNGPLLFCNHCFQVHKLAFLFVYTYFDLDTPPV